METPSISEELEGPEVICVSTIFTNWEMSSEDKGGAKHSGINSSNLAKPAMVSNLVGNADRVSSSPLAQGLVDGPWGPNSEPKQTKASRLEDIQQQNATARVSAQTSELLLAGWI